MTDGSKDLARELFEAALEIPAGRQAEFIREACSGDRELEQRLLRLLDAHHRETAMSSPVAGESVPEQIGPYRILESIGEGGMGVV